MTMALVALASTLVILGSLFLGTMPDREAHDRAVRKAVGEALAVQLAEQLRRDEATAVEHTLANIVARTEGLRSVGVRRADGTLLIETGAHARNWQLDEDERSRPEQVSVPLQAKGQRWGRVELAFAAKDENPVLAFLREPLVQMLLFMTVGGWVVFGLYMRRALMHLDPSSVVPERVQGAFDAMAEGVVVLDTRGRMMMCNKAFRALHPELAGLMPGSTLGSLPWLASALPDDASQHPWMRAMTEREANSGTAFEVGAGQERHQLVFNAAPICDAGGAVRGCMVTISDMTALHRANEALRSAMAELAASNREVEEKNAELERLATRDSLTGVLNRRAFHAAYEAVVHEARRAAQSVTCLMIDIDHFKRINDSHGHAIGDRVIQEVARKLSDCVRGKDLVCRWGGEEFCVVAAGLDADAAVDLAERMRMRIEREVGAAVREVPGLRVTASLGVEIQASQGELLAALVERADQALYRAKRDGRNRVHAPAAATLDRAATPAADEETDAATGCLNARGWEAAQARLRDLARANDRVLGCLVVGIDRANEVSAQFGADALKTACDGVARCTRESAPAAALVARLDDRRVAVLMAGMGVEDCELLAEHLRARVQKELAGHIEGAPPDSLTISVGIDVLPANAPGAAMLAERAEQAMGRVRRAGGNGLALFSRLRAANGASANGGEA
jgi:diguanylate cyclase (GGDEF)-like protein